ncbi:hypothetical protein HBH92_091450 [Parastagonospora nodorum]|nr:hypothetical protein HBH92_091450 [Parastagonospora nodorum]
MLIKSCKFYHTSLHSVSGILPLKKYFEEPRVESDVRHTLYLLNPNIPYTVSLPTRSVSPRLVGVSSDPSSHTIIAEAQKNTRRNPKQQIGIFLFAPRGNHSETQNSSTNSRSIQENGKSKKTATHSNKQPCWPFGYSPI